MTSTSEKLVSRPILAGDRISDRFKCRGPKYLFDGFD